MTEDKKQNIIDAAIQVFSKHGYERGTVSEIANQANIAKGSFYHYYNSKEEIVYDLFKMVFDKFLDSWNTIIEKDISPDKKVELLIDRSFDDIIEMLEEKNVTSLILIFEIMFFLYRKSLKTGKENVIEKYFLKYYDILKPIFEEGQEADIFRQDIDPSYLAYLFFSMVDGFGLHFMMQKDNFDAEKSRKYLKAILLEGLIQK
ncbi:MAG: TetR/AcrR family transcriptional regulator [Candidatus Marinimicrobia bacterium]|nr:TetR/AcrR family transcriptional regulator [Candidatus Neomarinimicrobiota bacterium]